MSWREILGFRPREMLHPAHNPQNTQKPIDGPNCADIADSALSQSDEGSRLLEVLSFASNELNISSTEVRDALAPEDILDWRDGKLTEENLAAFARLLVQRREMDRGQRPARYTEVATCRQCGPIWLWFPGEVLGCPWCWNRVSHRPIPRPGPVRCGNCAHFRRRGRSKLGHCARGEPEALGGLWDSDWRSCRFYLPGKETTTTADD
jgi:hypothetical protein